MNGEFAIFRKLDTVRKMVASVADREGWSESLASGGAFVIYNFDERGSFFAQCTLFLRSGLRVPISGSFAEGQEGRALDPDVFAQQVIATCRELIRDVAVHVTRKTELKAMIEKNVAKARRQGMPINLLSITERSVTAGHPNRDGAVYFDVTMSHLDEHGKLNTFIYDAANADEFGDYLADKIIEPLKSRCA